MKVEVVKKKISLRDLVNELEQRGELFKERPMLATSTENILLKALKQNKIEVIQQFSLSGRCFDFKVYHYPVLIEVDGGVHKEERKRLMDYRKDRFVQRRGYKVLRYSNGEIQNNVKRVIWEIKTTMYYCGYQPKEVHLYPLSIWEQIKVWWRKVFKREAEQDIYGEFAHDKSRTTKED